MAPNTSGWWTDEKVDATVTSQYVHSHLRPNEAEQLTKSVFGDLSDDTYLEWILTRAKRFFLTLVEAGVPDQIFGIIDDSWDDEDLPIPEEEVPGLLLSAEPDKILDRRFYTAQFKYLIRVIGDGEHIRYAQEETIPVTTLGMKTVLGKGKDAPEKVKLSSDNRRVFARKRIVLKNRHMEEELLAEMADWRTFAHEHVLSIFGSYTTEDQLYVLMTPASDCSLKSFLDDPPKAFESLTKSERRRTALQWSHCLATGLGWLHGHRKHHGAIRPSRIHIDDRWRIYLGQFDGTGILCDNTVKDDIEAYQYAAPERWKRSVTIQATGNARTPLPSGGRTARRMTMEVERTLSPEGHDTHSSSSGTQGLSTARPTSVSYVFSPTSKSGTRLRLGSAKSAVAKVSNSFRNTESRQSHHMSDGLRPIRTSLEAHARPGPSPALSASSDENVLSRRRTGPIYAAAPEMRTAVVQTWTSAQHDQLAADIFSLGAILMDIMTFLCKHSHSSFARHRATKNKSAGRGGGLADASFHANIGQVFGWAEVLQKDAEKRIKKDDGAIFKAVGPCLQVILQCLERTPGDRLHAEELQRKLCDHIRDFAGLNTPPCCLDNEIERFQDRPQSRTASVDLMRQRSASRSELERTDSRARSRNEIGSTLKQHASGFSPRIDSLKISPANLNAFKFDTEYGQSTLVNSESQTRNKSRERPDSFSFKTGDNVEVFPRPPTATSKHRQPNQDTESQTSTPISPVFAGIARSNVHGLVTYPSAPSAAASTIGATDDFQSVYSYTPPPSAHPTRELPPIPRGANVRAPLSNMNPARRAKQTPSNSATDHEPTALPALPSIERTAVMNNLHSRAMSASAASTSATSTIPHRRATSRMDDLDEITPAPVQPTNERHYRAPSRTGMSENRMYVSHMGRDKLGLRGLQYP